MADVYVVEFDVAVQTLDALNAAAYRLLDVAHCSIEKHGNRFVCRLTPKASVTDAEAVRLRFLDTVTDENLRQTLAAKTEPVRNVILSLAFGALASSEDSGKR
jgi:His-Xaa-Ser system protein HxsD